jgi:hypothetical protein
VYAMCVIDALGIPAMLRADAVITSADRRPSPVTSAVSATWHPLGAVLFAGCAGGGGRAEQNCCGYLNFFASAANAVRYAGLWWRA